MKKIILLTIAVSICVSSLHSQTNNTPVEVILEPSAQQKNKLQLPSVNPPQPTDVQQTSKPTPPPLFTAFQEPDAEEYMFANKVDANDFLLALARKEGLQYFPSQALEKVKISGRFRSGSPRQTIDDLCNSYNFIAYDSAGTLFVRTQDELKGMPPKVVTYQLRYLRQDNVETLVAPLLTPDVGKVKMDTKSNMVIIRDNEFALHNILAVLRKLDDPHKKIINVQVNILRFNDTNNGFKGMDFSQALGKDGYALSFGTANSLDMLFNMADKSISPTPLFTGPTAAILRPGEFKALFRFLTSSQAVEQLSSPNILVEDNEDGGVNVVDRYPIVEFQPSTTQSSGSNFVSLSSKIRYKIDENDPTPSEKETGRELGVSLRVRPTVLEDQTIRMAITPRAADIRELIEVPTGSETPSNKVPRVSESSSKTIVRIPDGHTVVLGGYYQVNKSKEVDKIPILGDIPLINFLFKSETTANEKTRLVFMLTPSTYDPSNPKAVAELTEKNNNFKPQSVIDENRGEFKDPLEKKQKK